MELEIVCGCRDPSASSQPPPTLPLLPLRSHRLFGQNEGAVEVEPLNGVEALHRAIKGVTLVEVRDSFQASHSASSATVNEIAGGSPSIYMLTSDRTLRDKC